METATPHAYSLRQKQIVDDYTALLDKHLAEIRSGATDEMLEISDFARLLHIHPRHLSNTVHAVTQGSACDIFEAKILAAAKDLILNTTDSIGAIARQLTYDPSNFTKFFKAYTGVTPKQFREAQGKI